MVESLNLAVRAPKSVSRRSCVSNQSHPVVHIGCCDWLVANLGRRCAIQAHTFVWFQGIQEKKKWHHCKSYSPNNRFGLILFEACGYILVSHNFLS